MTDDTEPLDVTDDSAVDDKTAKLLKEVRSEAAKRRVQNRELMEQLEQMRADYQAAMDQAEQLKVTAERTSSELEKERAARQKEIEVTNAANQAVISSLPEKLRGLVPTDYDPFRLRQWLDAAVPTLTTVAPPQLDGEVGSKQDRASETVAVGEAEVELAKALGIDPTQLVKTMTKAR